MTLNFVALTINSYQYLLVIYCLTITVVPFPLRLSANNFVSLVSLTHTWSWLHLILAINNIFEVWSLLWSWYMTLTLCDLGIKSYWHLLVISCLTIRVTPFPPRLSANNFVSLLSLYGIWPWRLLGSPSDDIQLPSNNTKLV